MIFLYILTFLIHKVLADYECLCSYMVETKVYSQPDLAAPSFGSLYEFDCKQSLPLDTKDGWQAIAFEHKVGYVKENEKVMIQICPGDPQLADKVTITSTTILPTDPSSTLSSTTFIRPQPTSSRTSTRITATASTKILMSSTNATLISSAFPQATDKPANSSWSNSASTKIPITSTTTKLTTSQRYMSATSKPSTSSESLTSTSLVTNGQPTTTTTRRTITLRPGPTIQSVMTGNINLCPSILHRYTLEDGGALTQYDSHCYELVPIRATWSKALGDCRAKGGTLFSIQDQAFQNYMYNWVKSYKFDHAIWTGLTDILVEEQFEWVSGEPLVYTNWYRDRYGNLASHQIEDCVLFVPYAPYYGKWDDAHCGQTSIFGDSGQTSPFICQFSIYDNHGQPSGLVG